MTSVGARLMSAMLKGSVSFAHVAWLIAASIGFFMAGPMGAANAFFGGAIVVLFFATGQGVHVLAGELDPRSGMGLILTSYAVRCAALGGLLYLALNSERFATLFRPMPFFVACMVVLAGWLTGMFWVHAHARIPVYDSLDEPAPATRGSDER